MSADLDTDALRAALTAMAEHGTADLRTHSVDVFALTLQPNAGGPILVIGARTRDRGAYELSFQLSNDPGLNAFAIETMVEQAEQWKREVW